MQEEDKKIEKSETALREERILEFWKENKIFSKTLSASKGKKEFIFYEGPPTANGEPGLHHLIARAFKDAIPRYKTMQGYHVRRKGGWDTHGLPVELQVEKKLGLNSKKAIEEYGVAKFNQECRKSVWEYLDVWEKFTDRIGFWIDQDNPYVTYHNEYIESVWNIIKKVDEQNLLYKDYKVVPWCPRCGTVLSSHELALGYKDVKDLSVYVKFKVATPIQKNSAALPASGLRHGQNFPVSAPQYILAWTTTPWTLPGNLALAVGENIDYVKVKVGKEIFILAKERISILPEDYEVLEEIKGKDLIGLRYEPLFPFYRKTVAESEKLKLEKAYQVYEADFVTTEDGTGVVHTAVMYGQEDFVLGTKIGLPKHHLVGLDGKFLPGTEFLEGRFTRDEETVMEIIKYLTEKGLMLKKEKYEHSYPHCWRCQTALIYYARDSWYIKMSDPKIKEQLISQNKEINWEPAHIREGRFGEWLREIKDWAISRERYWGTPLPVWICEACKKIEVIESIEDLKEKTKKSGNQYFVMRHGEAENNIKDIINSNPENIFHLTEKGKKQTEEATHYFKDRKIDLILCSPFARCKETAEIIRPSLGLAEEAMITDEKLGEFRKGPDFEGKKWSEYWKLFKNTRERFEKAPGGGENLLDLNKRLGEFIYDLEKKYSDKKILIVSHEGPIVAMQMVAQGAGIDECIKLKQHQKEIYECTHALPIELFFTPLPHNENYELDLHRPYIDEVKLVCARATAGQACGGNLVRTKEVMDVWLDSGAMPFAQDHYPFDPEGKGTSYGAGNKKVQEILYPADFICEAIDQTRGWFYTLHAIGILMGRGKAYKNAICLGHILDKEGKKMSKSVGNVVDPWTAVEKYGADTLRLWMYSINQPGESKNFDEKTVALLHQQVFGLLYNVLAFYELYPIPEQTRYGAGRDIPPSNHVLDKWILVRLDELIKIITDNLENYKLLEPTRALRDFIGDLSTWYLRRSRERIKNEAANPEGKQASYGARQTLYYVLKTLAKLMAPFAPFSAEDIWQKLKSERDLESVHLENWPKTKRTVFFEFLRTVLGKKNKIIEEMEKTRKIVTFGLEARQKAGIKVRQPLSQLQIKNYKLETEYLELIKEELNVKEIIFDNSIAGEAELDINITEELKTEGNYRELVRGLQEMRKKAGLTPSNIIALLIETDDAGKGLIQKFEADMKKTILISKIEFKTNDGTEITIDNLDFRVKIDKI